MPKSGKKIKKRGINYAKYSPEMLSMALETLRAKLMSSYEAEKTFGIPRRTLLDKLHDKHPLSMGGQTWLKEEQEDDIVKVLVVAADYGSPLTTLDLRLVVQRYLAENQINVFSGKLPGQKWVNWFIKRNRHRLTYRVTQNIKRSRAEKNPEEMTEYFKNLEKSLEGVPKENILNYDETNLSDNPGTQKCLFRRGVKYPERVMNFTKGAISIMFAITAGGECLQPYIVYKAEHLYQQWTINGPKGARYNRSKSGWFDAKLFEDWFVTIVLPWAKKNEGPKILIGDNLASHLNIKIVKLCEDHDIRFVFLPPNSTHLTQPLDVCYFGPLKKLWRATLLNYKIKNPREATINKSHFPELLKQLMFALNDKKSNIYSAFKSTGINPLNSYEVLKRLPDYKVPLEYSVDKALLDYLKESRAPNPMKKVRNKKLKVPPGKSISSEDFFADTNSTAMPETRTPSDVLLIKPKNPETLQNICLKYINKKRTNKKIIVLENKTFTPKKRRCNPKGKQMVDRMKHIDKNTIITVNMKQKKITETAQIKTKHDKAEKNKEKQLKNKILKKRRTKVKTKAKKKKFNDSDISESDTDEERALTFSESENESWDEFRKRLLKDEAERQEQEIMDQDIEKEGPQNKLMSMEEVNNNFYNTDLTSSIREVKQEIEPLYKTQKQVKIKQKGKLINIKQRAVQVKKEEESSSMARRKENVKQEGQSLSKTREQVKTKQDGESISTTRSTVEAKQEGESPNTGKSKENVKKECKQYESEELSSDSDNYFLSSIWKRSSNLQSPIGSPPCVGDYVIVKFNTKKTIRHFIGKIDENLGAGGWRVRFLRRKLNSFVWPQVDDYAYVVSEDIIIVLPAPLESRRGKLDFNFDFKMYNIS